MPSDIRDKLHRALLWAELAREGGILLAIFGPIATLEIWHELRWKPIVALSILAVIMLLYGVERDVQIQRLRRKWRLGSE
jgi:hypothetical protein